MTQKKLVLKVPSMKDRDSRKKALKVVSSFTGLDSVAIIGADKDQIEICGPNIDVLKITTKLRKKVGTANIVTYGEVQPPKKEEKKEENRPFNMHAQPQPQPQQPQPQQPQPRPQQPQSQPQPRPQPQPQYQPQPYPQSFHQAYRNLYDGPLPQYTIPYNQPPPPPMPPAYQEPGCCIM